MTVDVTNDCSNTPTCVDEIQVVEEEPSSPIIGQYVGQCKWFNDMLGFGFVTVCEGVDKGKDIFVHHTGIKPLNSNYRTLKKGEYLNFNIINGMNGLQAVDVTGINGGPLMCDFVSITRPTTTPPTLPRRSNDSSLMRPATGGPDMRRHVPSPNSMQQAAPTGSKASTASTPQAKQSGQSSQWHVVTKNGRKKNLLKYSKEGRMAMKQAKQDDVAMVV